jgi:MFS family permease
LSGVTLRHVFLLSAVPAVVVILVLVWGVPESGAGRITNARAVRLRGDWQELGNRFHRLLAAILVFTLGNSTDAFLLLGLSQAGVPAPWVAVLWALHSGVRMTAAFAGGAIADRYGGRKPMAAGWILYALVYLGFGIATSAPVRVALFVTYGVYYGLTEPAEKAWISRLVPENLRGTAFGYYNCAIGVGALPASLLFGFLFQTFGAAAAFGAGAALAFLAVMLLLTVPPDRPQNLP